jgi:hypothetical protein
MNWAAFGSIAEALGAAGVVVTLIFLVGQVRTGNRLLRSESTRTSLQLNSDVGLAIAESREVAEVFNQGLADPGSLDRTDKTRFTWLMSMVINSQYGSYEDFELGLVTEQDIGDIRRSIGSVLDTPGGRWWWQKNKESYSDAFTEYVDRKIWSA